MTGSALQAMDVVGPCDSYLLGEEFEEGKGHAILPGRRLADDGKRPPG